MGSTAVLVLHFFGSAQRFLSQTQLNHNSTKPNIPQVEHLINYWPNFDQAFTTTERINNNINISLLTQNWPNFKGRPTNKKTTALTSTTTTTKSTTSQLFLARFWPNFKSRFLGSATIITTFGNKQNQNLPDKTRNLPKPKLGSGFVRKGSKKKN